MEWMSQARPHILLHTSVYANANGHAHALYYNMSRRSPPAPPFSFLYTLLIHSILESDVRDEPMPVRGYTSDKITDERPFKVQLEVSIYDDQESKSPCGLMFRNDARTFRTAASPPLSFSASIRLLRSHHAGR